MTEQQLESLDFADYLRPIAPLSPLEALARLETIEGVQLQLAAHEPRVVDPVACAFDHRGRLYVAELRDYPFRPADHENPLGRIRLLEDRDGDGVYETSTVFADGLLWAAGVAPWKDGVFVTAPPDIWYLKDTTGDGVADLRERVFTGFGTSGSQYIVNNLIWGLDHRIYASVAGNGGAVRAVASPDSPKLPLRRMDFVFSPDTLCYEAVAGGVQFGHTFDDWGNRFHCSQDCPIYHEVFQQRYLDRNSYLSEPRAIHRVTLPPVPVYRSSPLERWRIIRSSRRVVSGRGTTEVTGVSHHVADGCAGTTVYRGDALAELLGGQTFTGDAQSNLVHRRQLVPRGASFDSLRLDEQTEFLRSSDNWFRPVNFANAPDGSLLVLDLCREILEAVHIPFDVVEHLDLTSGRDAGRIIRVMPVGFQPPPIPDLGQASDARLVGYLEHPNAWHRETAHRLLFERQAVDQAEAVRALLRNSPLALGRLHALWTLAGWTALTSDDLLAALGDRHPSVREHAIRLSEPRLVATETLATRLLELAGDEDPRVRFQMACTLGQLSGAAADAAWLRIAAVDADDPWTRTALLSSAVDRAASVLTALLSAGELSNLGRNESLINALAVLVGTQQDAVAISRLIESLPPAKDEAARPLVEAGLGEAVLGGLVAGLQLAGSRFESIGPLLSEAAGQAIDRRVLAALRTVADDGAEIGAVLAALRVLGLAEFSVVGSSVAKLIRRNPPQEVQVAAVRLLAGYVDPGVGQLLIDHWRWLGPTPRNDVLEALLARPERLQPLVVAIEQQRIERAEIPATYRNRLTGHASAEVVQRVEPWLRANGGSRQEIIDRYTAALDLQGDRQQGRLVFRRVCAACHRAGEEGGQLGPNLALASAKSRRELLSKIIDPNRDVDPAFLQYTAVDIHGNTHTGLLKADTPTAVVIASRDQQVTIPRGQIEQLVAGKVSMMPEGLEEGLSPQEMAHLLQFLSEIRYDIGTSGRSSREGYYPERPAER